MAYSSRRTLLLFPSLLLLAACPQEGALLSMRVQPDAEQAFLAAVKSFAHANAYRFDDAAFSDNMPYWQIELDGLRTRVSIAGNAAMGFEANVLREYNLFDFVLRVDLVALVQDFRLRVYSIEGLELVDRQSQ